MSFPAIFRGNVVPLLQCSSCSHLRFRPLLSCSAIARQKQIDFPTKHLLRFAFNMKRDVICSFSASETEPDRNEDNERKLHEEENSSGSADSASADTSEPNSLADQDNGQNLGMLESKDLVNGNSANANAQTGTEDADDIQIASGSPLPGLKPQQLDEAIRIPKETIDILKDQVFGFDTFFVTSQEPYEGGVLFKGNLRGQAARSYEKISKRMQIWRFV